MKSNISALSKEIIPKKLDLINNYKKKPLFYSILICVVLITLIKFNLIGNGFFFFPDESRYLSSQKAVISLSELNIGAAIKNIFSTQGRPADAIIKTIPNLVQLATAKINNLNVYESKNSFPLFIFNFISYCLILVLHFKFSKIILKDSFLALISVLLFSSLTNSHLYLRHALPYDTSLLLFYLVIYKTITYTDTNNQTFKQSLLLGGVAFLAYLIYPGYFPLYFIALFMFFINNYNKSEIFKKILHTTYFILGTIICLIIFESFSRFGGGSYIWDARHLSNTVSQGSYDESFTFIIKYLLEVEFLSGIIILISLLLFCILMIYQNTKIKLQSHIIILGISIFGMYLSYAFIGYFFHKLVFYGRLLHQFFPFICILSIFSINELILKTKNRQLIFVVLSFVLIFNFTINFNQYCSYSYPRDVGWQLCKTNNLKNIETNYEYDDSHSDMPTVLDFSNAKTLVNQKKNNHKILVVNCSHLFPINDISKYHKFIPNNNHILLDSKPHSINFKAYQYEGCSIIERVNIDKMNLNIQVFKMTGD